MPPRPDHVEAARERVAAAWEAIDAVLADGKPREKLAAASLILDRAFGRTAPRKAVAFAVRTAAEAKAARERNGLAGNPFAGL